MNAPDPPALDDDESLVDLRCSAVVIRGEEFLLVRRSGPDRADWVLPGGRPRPGESMQSCARRETLEETGLRVTPTRCAFVAEVIVPGGHGRTVELIFLAEIGFSDQHAALVGEPGTEPAWIHLDDLSSLHLRPPIAGYLPALARGTRDTAPYLGNVWRPARVNGAEREMQPEDRR